MFGQMLAAALIALVIFSLVANKDDLNVDQATKHLAHFLRSSTDELRYGVQALGKLSVHDVNRDDLIALDRVTADWARVKSLINSRTPSPSDFFAKMPSFRFRARHDGKTDRIHESIGARGWWSPQAKYSFGQAHPKNNQ